MVLMYHFCVESLVIPMVAFLLLGYSSYLTEAARQRNKQQSQQGRRTQTHRTATPEENGEIEIPKCNIAQQRCVQSVGCSFAISKYLMFCSPLINGETDDCTYFCKLALLALLSTADQTGDTFMTCDCEGDEFCMLQRTRLQVCQPEVMEEIQHVRDETTPLSCTLAEMVCAADTSCLSALDFYDQNCRKLLRGEKCTSRCNNSLSILYRQSKSHKLRNCICDGREDYDCPTLRYNTEALCFSGGGRGGRLRSTVPPLKTITTSKMHHNHHHKHHNHHLNHSQTHGADFNGGETSDNSEQWVYDDNELESSNTRIGSDVTNFEESNNSAQVANDKDSVLGGHNRAVGNFNQNYANLIQRFCLTVVSYLVFTNSFV